MVAGVGLADIQAGDGAAGDVVVRVDEEGRFVHAHDFSIGDGALVAAGGLGEQAGEDHENETVARSEQVFAPSKNAIRPDLAAACRPLRHGGPHNGG